MIPSMRYKYIEKVMYSYSVNKEMKEEYEQELDYIEGHGDVKVQSYNESTGGGEVPDRVLDYVHRKQVIEKKILRLNMEIAAVEDVMERLDKEGDEHSLKLYAVLQVVYFTSGLSMFNLLGVEDYEIQDLRHELVRLVNRRMNIYQKRMRDNA